MGRILAVALVALALPQLAFAQAAAPKATTAPTVQAPAGAPKVTTAPPAATTQVAPKAVAPAQATAAAPPALAPGAKISAPMIAVVDTQFVLSNAAATKGVNAQLQAISAVYSQEIAKLEEDLRTRDQELTRQQAIMAPDAYKAKRAEFDTALDNAQKVVDQRNSQLDAAYNQAMTKVRDEMLKVLSDISQQRGVNLVLDQTVVVFNLPALDLSREVVTSLDVRLPKVDVPTPVAGTAPPAAPAAPATTLAPARP